MKATIKDVANLAGVSIATVSHVINKTRYVSPDLVDKVFQAIDLSGYKVKLPTADSTKNLSKNAMIAMVLPTLESSVYSHLASYLWDCLSAKGYLLSVYITSDDLSFEKKLLNRLAADKRVSGIILSPCSSEPADYTKLISQRIPLVCLERAFESDLVDSVVSENKYATYKGTSHLIKSGHENIAILQGQGQHTTKLERLSGYRKALDENNINFRQDLILEVDENDENAERKIHKFYYTNQPTGIIAGGNRLTLTLLKAIQSMGLECPKDVSLIGYGDEEWCELTSPPLTTLNQDTALMARSACARILEKIQGSTNTPAQIRIPVQLTLRKSTQMIGRGPFGEKAFSPEELTLTETEIFKLKESHYKVGISFHYSGTAWTKLHEAGIRNTLDQFGIAVVSVTEAHFDPLLQVTQLEGLRMQKPDAVIAIPSDDRITAQKFKELASEMKLVFISNVPEGFQKDDYSTCVSVNERENGNNAGILIGEYFKSYAHAKIAFIGHGATFFGTHLRDMVAEQVVRENYPNIEVVEVDYFYQIENTYEICKDLICRHPQIDGLYISWERPALEAIRALRDLGREDISIFTFDLDAEIATYLAKGKMVRGLSTQRPYEQGVAVAIAVAKALLGEDGIKYIGVPPYVVEQKNLLRAWQEIMHEQAPEAIKDIIYKEYI